MQTSVLEVGRRTTLPLPRRDTLLFLWLLLFVVSDADKVGCDSSVLVLVVVLVVVELWLESIGSSKSRVRESLLNMDWVSVF